MAYILPRLNVGSDSEDEMLAQCLLNTRRAKKIRTRKDNFEEWNEIEFRQRYRLSKATSGILAEIRHRIEFATEKNWCLPAMEQLLMTLRFYATAVSYKTIGGTSGVHKATADGVISNVTAAIASLRPRYVSLPQTREDMRNVQRKLFDIAAFPRVIGAIDCTHVRIKSPGGEEAEHFHNRKGYFSFNVQALVDSDLVIRNIVARWPGSAHDSTIYNHSRLRNQLENNEFGNSVVFCDSAYAVGPCLLPPLQAPRLPEEQLYNEAQIRTRNVVERCYGVLKARFPVLSLGIQVNVNWVQNIIVACAVLHNIARANNEDVPPVVADTHRQLEAYMQEEQALAELQEVNVANRVRDGVRRTFVQYFLNRLQVQRV